MKKNLKFSKVKKTRRFLTLLISILCISILSLLIIDKYMEEKSYTDNTVEVKEELEKEVPICNNGMIESQTSNTVEDYEANDLMGAIYIPKTHQTIPLYLEDPNDPSNAVLELGVAMDSSSSYPYGTSSTVVFGHRHYDFSVLKELVKGDEIIVTIGENVYLYEVTSTEIVKEDEIGEVFTDKNELVLYTCYPFYWGATTTQRFVVHAEPVNSIQCE